MTGLFTIIMVLLSLTGLAYLASTDPKRRRIFRQKPLEARRLLWPARVALFLPGICLILLANWSGLAIWAGAVTVLGWVMAALQPELYARARAWVVARSGLAIVLVRHVTDQVGIALTAARRRAAAKAPRVAGLSSLEAQITRLEARVAQLEAENAALRDADASSTLRLAERQPADPPRSGGIATAV